MNLKIIFVITLFNCINRIISIKDKHCNEFFESCDKKDVVDPFDMFGEEIEENHKNAKNKILTKTIHQESKQVTSALISKSDENVTSCSCEELSYCQKNLKEKIKRTSDCENDFLYLKRTIKKMVNKYGSLGIDKSDTTFIKITIRNSDIDIMNSFNVKPCDRIQELDGILSEMINSAEIYNPLNDKNYDKILFLESEYIIISIAVFIQITILWYISLHFPIRKIVSVISMFLFIINVAWHWIYLVKKEYSNLYAELDKTNLPLSCHPEQLSWGNFIRLWFSNDFSFDKQCKKYFENIHISPMLKITPMMAVSETVSQLILHPFQILGENIGLFYQKLFSQLSWYLKLPVGIFIVLFMFMLLIMLFGYRIRLPFFLGSIEPASSSKFTKESNDSHLMQGILRGEYQILKSESIKSISMQPESEIKTEYQITATDISKYRINEESDNILPLNLLKSGLCKDVKGKQTELCECKNLCQKFESVLNSRKFIEDEENNESYNKENDKMEIQ